MKTLSRTIGLTLVLLTMLVGVRDTLAADAPLDTLREASAPQDPRYAGASLDSSRKLLPEVTASSVPVNEAPDQPPRLDDPLAGNYRYHLARQAAVEGMVLLKNDGVLPLAESSLKSLAVIGPNALKGQIQGGGSSSVKPHYQNIDH